MPPRGRWRPWFPVAIFALVSLAYFHEFVTSNEVVFGVDVGTDYHLGSEGITAKLGELFPPLWGTEMGGYPSSDGLRWQYFPTYAIYLFTSFHRHLGWRYILTLMTAGLSMFAYLRSLSLSRGAAIWGGLAYMLAPTSVTFTYAGHYAKMAVIALFPFMCRAVHLLVVEGRYRSAVPLALLIGLGVYTPHLQMLYYALWGVGLYFVWVIVWIARQGVARAHLAGRGAVFAGAVILGLGLGSEGLWPAYLHTTDESKRAAAATAPDEDARLEFARSWSLHPEEVASLLVPEFVGYYDPRGGQDHYWGRNPFKLNSEYFGAIVVFLALLAVPQMRFRVMARLMGALFCCALLYGLGPHTPLHRLAFYLIPGAKVLRTPGMIAFLFAFPACCLAAMTLDGYLCRKQGNRLPSSRHLAIAGSLTGFLALLLLLAPGATTSAWLRLTGLELEPSKQQALAGSLAWMRHGGLLVIITLIAAIVTLQLRRAERLGPLMTVALLGMLTVADAVRIDYRFLRYENPDRYPDLRLENPRIRHFLTQQERARVMPLPGYQLLQQPGYRLHEVPLVTGFHDFTMRRYDRLLQELTPVTAMFQAKFIQGRKIPYTDAELLAAVHPLLDLLNARFLVTPTTLHLQVPAFPPAFQGRHLRLYENPQALSWYFTVGDTIVIEDEAQIISTLRDGRLDLHRTAILEDPADALEISGEGLAGDRVTEQLYDPAGGHILLQTTTAGPRLLVVSENYHPGWHALVDAQPTAILRADYVWQAIALPAGHHQVELRFHSAILHRSRWASGLSLCAWLLLTGVTVARRRRR